MKSLVVLYFLPFSFRSAFVFRIGLIGIALTEILLLVENAASLRALSAEMFIVDGVVCPGDFLLFLSEFQNQDSIDCCSCFESFRLHNCYSL